MKIKALATYYLIREEQKPRTHGDASGTVTAYVPNRLIYPFLNK